MKLLHTADLHLSTPDDLPSLSAVLESARTNSCGIVLIAGDMFDTPAAARNLSVKTSAILESFGGEVWILPGNHDEAELKTHKSLSRNSRILHSEDQPLLVERHPDFDLYAVPYSDTLTMADFSAEKTDPSRAILLAHGNYNEVGFFGKNDDDSGYFPIFPEDVRDRFRYVALGHFHSWKESSAGRTTVVYSGSPRITRASDYGRRRVSILDTSSWKASAFDLPMPYIEPITIRASVADTPESLENRVFEMLSSLRLPELASASIRFSGFVRSQFDRVLLKQNLESRLQAEFGNRPFQNADTESLELLRADLGNHPLIRLALDESFRQIPEAEREAYEIFALSRLQAITGE